jgi:hypothetical protein
MLHDEAPVYSSPQVGNVQGIDIQALNLDAGSTNDFVAPAQGNEGSKG